MFQIKEQDKISELNEVVSNLPNRVQGNDNKDTL